PLAPGINAATLSPNKRVRRGAEEEVPLLTDVQEGAHPGSRLDAISKPGPSGPGRVDTAEEPASRMSHRNRTEFRPAENPRSTVGIDRGEHLFGDPHGMVHQLVPLDVGLAGVVPSPLLSECAQSEARHECVVAAVQYDRREDRLVLAG